MKDLLILVADKAQEFTFIGLLSRNEALGIRKIEYEIRIDPERDSGCAVRGVEFLSHFADKYKYALLIFDHEGSGEETTPREVLEQKINADFIKSSWGDRARVVVISPELEAWVWSSSPHVDKVAGWENQRPKLRLWLVEKGFLREKETKPARPKEAFKAALRTVGKPRSASLYKQIAEKVSLNHCTDPAFRELKQILRGWFPVD